MVTILPPKTNVGTQIGQSLGQGVQSGMQQGFQRGLLQQALGKVRGLAGQENVKPLDLMLGLMEAGAGIPGSEKYLGPLLQPLLQAAQIGGMPGFGKGAGAETPQGQPSPPGVAPSQTFGGMPSKPGAEGGTEPLNFGKFLPLDIGDLVSPDQSQEILRNVIGSGGDPNLARSLIKDYNQGKITFNELANANIDRAYSQKQRELALESDLSQRIGEKLSPNEPPGFKSVAYNMVKPFMKQGMDFNSAWLRAEPEFNNFKRELSSFEAAIPEVNDIESSIGFSAEELPKFLGKGESIVKKYPAAYPILQDMFINKNHNPIAVANALNPLPPKVSQTIDKTKDFKSELYKPSGFRGEGFKDNLQDISYKQLGEIPSVSNQLVKEWNDKNSIIGIYGKLRERGWLPNNIHALIEDLRSKVKFSSQQEVEAAQILKNPPVPFLERRRFKK